MCFILLLLIFTLFQHSSLPCRTRRSSTSAGTSDDSSSFCVSSSHDQTMDFCGIFGTVSHFPCIISRHRPLSGWHPACTKSKVDTRTNTKVLRNICTNGQEHLNCFVTWKNHGKCVLMKPHRQHVWPHFQSLPALPFAPPFPINAYLPLQSSLQMPLQIARIWIAGIFTRPTAEYIRYQPELCLSGLELVALFVNNIISFQLYQNAKNERSRTPIGSRTAAIALSLPLQVRWPRLNSERPRRHWRSARISQISSIIFVIVGIDVIVWHYQSIQCQ